jgi:dipeptidase E
MRLLLISSSVVHGYGFLDQPEPFIREHFGAIRTVAFIPFAAHDHTAYTDKVRQRLGAMGYDVLSYDRLDDAEGVFVGGGNTFRLLKTLQERNLLEPLRARVRAGLPYTGSSAGSVITSPTIRTTNDMPIVEPPSLDSLGLIPFQLNCHYVDPDPASTHKGETREERIREFHEENTIPVVGLREGGCLNVEDDAVTLAGGKAARIFLQGREPFEVEPGTRLDVVLGLSSRA